MTIPGPMGSDELAHVSRPALHLAVDASTDKPADAVFVQFCPGLRTGLPPRARQRVREYIDAHLESNVSLEMLAGIAGLSISRFARAFKQSEGVTPHEYVMRCRVRRAQELLAATDMSLSQIAYTSGFSDQSHLTRRFREQVGLTPSSYRYSFR